MKQIDENHFSVFSFGYNAGYVTGKVEDNVGFTKFIPTLILKDIKHLIPDTWLIKEEYVGQTKFCVNVTKIEVTPR